MTTSAVCLYAILSFPLLELPYAKHYVILRSLS